MRQIEFRAREASGTACARGTGRTPGPCLALKQFCHTVHPLSTPSPLIAASYRTPPRGRPFTTHGQPYERSVGLVCAIIIIVCRMSNISVVVLFFPSVVQCRGLLCYVFGGEFPIHAHTQIHRQRQRDASTCDRDSNRVVLVLFLSHRVMLFFLVRWILLAPLVVFGLAEQPQCFIWASRLDGGTLRGGGRQ